MTDIANICHRPYAGSNTHQHQHGLLAMLGSYRFESNSDFVQWGSRVLLGEIWYLLLSAYCGRCGHADDNVQVS